MGERDGTDEGYCVIVDACTFAVFGRGSFAGEICVNNPTRVKKTAMLRVARILSTGVNLEWTIV